MEEFIVILSCSNVHQCPCILFKVTVFWHQGVSSRCAMFNCTALLYRQNWAKYSLCFTELN